MSSSYFFTSESVSEGHPDKVSDRISDEVVDAFYRESAAAGLDPWAVRAACETLCTTNRVVIAGERVPVPVGDFLLLARPVLPRHPTAASATTARSPTAPRPPSPAAAAARKSSATRRAPSPSACASRAPT